MGQMNFFKNIGFPPNSGFLVLTHGSLNLFAINITDSLSFNYPNLAYRFGTNNRTFTISMGLYSLSGSTLSLANSGTGRTSGSNLTGYITFATSATQNVTPGTWFIGLVASTAGSSNWSLLGAFNNRDASNIFPGTFIGGRMSDSTLGLPASIATSDLDVTGSDAMQVAYILIGA